MRVSYIVLILLLASCQTLPAPEREGAALPTPTTPLSQTGPFLGDKPTDVDALTKQFGETVFLTEDGGAYPHIRKWAGSINYVIASGRGIDGRVAKMVAKVAPVAGLEVTKVNNRANVAFVTQPGEATDYHCHAKMFYDPADGTVAQAHIFVGPTLPDEHLAECIEEEFSQILGPGNDTLVLEQSLWRPWEQKTYRGLTWSDAVILRALYDERLKPGMHRDKAMPLVRQIIGELLEELNR